MSREWIYAQAPARASKMADRCAIMAATQIHVHEEAVLQKKSCFKYAAAALRRSVGLPG